ncbi:glutathione peroxidase 7 isoform X2 [Equus przewalskii]|uniref:Glutathione peroxidase n=1 Tax=Equus przewalskii TaxID=9798 RepID=A0ABM4NL89_EQUPR
MGKLRSRAWRSTARGEREGGASCLAGRLAPGPPPPAPRAGSPRPVFALATPPPRERVMVAALVAAWLLLAVAAGAQREQDFYDFKAVNIRGKLVSLEKYRGSVSLVVNVASECGFTDQHYRALQQLQRDLGPHHFNVLAFPCNQFGQQEPDSNKEIESFARRTYSVSFPMFSKIAVVGTGAHPAFKYLTRGPVFHWIDSWVRTWHCSSNHAEAASHMPQLEGPTKKNIQLCTGGLWGEKGKK